MKKELLIPVAMIMVMFSCAPRNAQVLPPDYEDIFIGASDSLFSLEMLFVAATPDYLIFEAEYINQSDSPVELKREDFELRIPERALKTKSYKTDDLVEFLLLERKAARKTKRNQTILNGLNLAGTVFFGFSGPFAWRNLDFAFYSISDVLVLTGDRRFSNRQINSIEEQIDYLREVNLETVTVAPKETVYKEIFFPFDNLVSGDVEVIYQPNDIEYKMILTREDLLHP